MDLACLDSCVSAEYIANPGCFATVIQLSLLPLAKAGLLKNDVHINAITGSTGAGQSFSETAHFSWRNNNVSVYKPFAHQHLDEIGESIHSLQSNYDKSLNFIPVRGDFTRGIFSSLYTKTEVQEEFLIDLYKEFYKDAPFTFVQEETVHLKQVVNTNNCIISVQKVDGKILISGAIDNLLKGAAGQAIQNMNLMFGWKQTLGLEFKASYF